MNQAEFTRAFHLPINTLREWELRRSIPDASARALLLAIERDDEADIGRRGAVRAVQVADGLRDTAGGHLSAIDCDSNPVLAATNPLGVRGAGEAGNVSALGIGRIETPATPERLRRAIKEVG